MARNPRLRPLAREQKGYSVDVSPNSKSAFLIFRSTSDGSSPSMPSFEARKSAFLSSRHCFSISIFSSRSRLSSFTKSVGEEYFP